VIVTNVTSQSDQRTRVIGGDHIWAGNYLRPSASLLNKSKGRGLLICASATSGLQLSWKPVTTLRNTTSAV